MSEWLHGPGEVRVNTATREAYVGSTQIPLTRLLFEILVTLLQHRGRVVTTDELIETVWGFEEGENQRFAQTAVYRLRKQLAAAGSDNVIESVRGVGVWIRDSESPPAVPSPSIATAALDAATTGLIMIGGDGRVVWTNRAADQLTGYKDGELVGQPVLKLHPQQPDATPHVCKPMRRGFNFRWPELPIVTKDGDSVRVSASLKLLTPGDQHGEALFELWPLGAASLQSQSDC